MVSTFLVWLELKSGVSTVALIKPSMLSGNTANVKSVEAYGIYRTFFY